MEQEFIQNQEIHRPREEQNDVCHYFKDYFSTLLILRDDNLNRVNEQKLMIYEELP